MLFICGAPFFVFAFKIGDMYLEERVKMIIDFYKSEKVKTYQNDSLYEKLSRCIEYSKLKRELKRVGANSGGDIFGFNTKK